MNTFEIAKHTQQLPTKLDEIVKFLYVGEAGLAWGRKVLSQMKTAGVVDKEHETLLQEAQRLGDLVLDANVRLGELLPDTIQTNKDCLVPRHGAPRKHGKFQKELPEGVNGKKAHIARKLAANPAAVAKIKAEARKNDDIPSKTAVINHIKFEKEKARRMAAEKNKTENTAIISLDEQQYINALERVINILPQKPPKVWNEKGFNMAQKYVKIIMNRLIFFENNNKQIGE